LRQPATKATANVAIGFTKRPLGRWDHSDVDEFRHVSERTGWSESGGGVSQYEPKPTYQTYVSTASSTNRTDPDVSYNATQARACTSTTVTTVRGSRWRHECGCAAVGGACCHCGSGPGNWREDFTRWCLPDAPGDLPDGSNVRIHVFPRRDHWEQRNLATVGYDR